MRLNPLTAVLISSTCHELCASGVSSWWALLYFPWHCRHWLQFMILPLITWGAAQGVVYNRKETWQLRG